MAASLCKALERNVFDVYEGLSPLVSLCADYWLCLTDHGKRCISTDAMIGKHCIVSIHTHHNGTVRMFTELREMLDPALGIMENRCAVCLSVYEQAWVVFCASYSMMNAYTESIHEGWR